MSRTLRFPIDLIIFVSKAITTTYVFVRCALKAYVSISFLSYENARFIKYYQFKSKAAAGASGRTVIMPVANVSGKRWLQPNK